jgi:anti-sigma factor RsiW
MTCQEIEISIPDYQENRLPPAEWRDVETHLAGCAKCRVFARQLRDLDAALATRLKVPELSADFDRQVMAQIRCGSGTLTPAQRAERKLQIQEEFEIGVARIFRGSFGLASVLNQLAWPGAAVVAGWLAWQLTTRMTAHLTAQSLGGLSPALLPWLVASATFLAVCLGQAFPRQRTLLGVQ